VGSQKKSPMGCRLAAGCAVARGVFGSGPPAAVVGVPEVPRCAGWDGLVTASAQHPAGGHVRRPALALLDVLGAVATFFSGAALLVHFRGAAGAASGPVVVVVASLAACGGAVLPRVDAGGLSATV